MPLLNDSKSLKNINNTIGINNYNNKFNIKNGIHIQRFKDNNEANSFNYNNENKNISLYIPELSPLKNNMRKENIYNIRLKNKYTTYNNINNNSYYI